MCLTSDGWTNISNYPVVNYMAVSSETSLFLESVCAGDQGHTVNWIAQDLKRIMEKFINVSRSITNIIEANEKAWKILEREFPGKLSMAGCHMDLIYK